MNRKELLDKLATNITGLNKDHPIRVGIDGVDASGKTSLAEELAEHLQSCRRQIIRASIDGFHNPREVRYKKGRNSPEGYYLDSFDNKRAAEVLLNPLGPAGNLKFRTAVFDYRSNSEVISPIQQADRDAILIMEGVFLFRPELIDCWDLRMFVDVDFETTVDRAVRREVERDKSWQGREAELKEQYHQRYVPGQKIYFDEAQPKQKADIVIDNSNFESPTMTFN